MLKVTFFQRRARKGFDFSLESIFEEVRHQLATQIEAKVKICSRHNDAWLTKLFNIAEATFRQSKTINHITGEVHFLNLFMRKKTVLLTVLDCRFMDRKQGWQKILMRWLYLTLPIKKARYITAISESTKQDILKYTNCPSEKIKVIPVAIDKIYQSHYQSFNDKKPTILHIGTGENKNLLRLIEALTNIPCQLSIIGKLSEEQKTHLAKYQIEYSNAYNISQAEMLQQYQACDLLAFVSTFEGFGMPIIEANSVERPVLTSNISSMPEVAGDAALLVNPYEVKDIRSGILQLINDADLRQKLIEAGRKNKLRFQSKAIAQQYFGLYQKIASVEPKIVAVCNRDAIHSSNNLKPAPNNFKLNKTMRILFPTGSFFPAQTGGPDNTVYWITKALKQNGTEVEVVSTERGLSATIPRNEWLKKDYADVIYTTNFLHYFPWRLILAALNRLGKAEVLHLSMIFYPASFLLAVLNALFYRKPVVWSIHGDLDPHMLNRSKWKKRPIQFLIKYWLKKKVIFHSTCEEETQYVKANFGQNIKVVQLTNYMELPVPLKVEKEKYFLYLGRIDSKKAIENLIEALYEAELFLPSDFQLKIAGNHHNAYGNQLVELVKRLGLQHKVKFIGHIAGEAKQRLLASAHFLFMPSHTENFGIVVAEALAQGTPAVASKQTPWAILEEKQAGFWVTNDVNSLANCIDQILKLHPKTYQEICQNTRPLAVKEFDIQQNIYKWQEVYHALIHAKNKPYPTNSNKLQPN